MKTAAHSAAWTSVGWIGSALFLLTWAEVALPGARQLLASILPLQVFATLLIASGPTWRSRYRANCLRRKGFSAARVARG